MTLRKLRWTILAYAVFDLLLGVAAAQFTTVSGTVTDPSGLPYAGGTITAVLQSSGSPTLNGLPYSPPTQPTGLSSAGSFVRQLADNGVLLPAASKWQFTVCSGAATVQPAIGKGPVCFSLAAPITITGASQDISAQLNAAALALLNSVPVAPIFSTAVTGTSMVTAGVNTVIVGPVSMVTPGANGTYRFVVQITQTTPGSGGTCAAGIITGNLSYKDADTGVTYALGTASILVTNLASASIGLTETMTSTANGVTNNYTSILRDFRAASGTAIQYQFYQSTNSNCTTPPVFAIRPALYYMGY